MFLVAHPVGDSALLSDCLWLPTDYFLGLLDITLQETVVKHTSIVNVHVYLLIYSNTQMNQSVNLRP